MPARPLRREACANLRRVLAHGPSLSLLSFGQATPDSAERDVRLWLNTWVIPEIRKLVPELRDLPASEPR
jgi:hypothetical protein